MEIYIDIYIPTNGEKVSVINKKLIELGLKPTIGEHDYIFNWKRIVTIDEELEFIDTIQEKLRGTGVILKFKTVR